MTNLINHFPLVFFFAGTTLILLIKPRQDLGYLSTLPFRLVIAAYVTIPFAFVKLFNDTPESFLTLAALALSPFMLLSGAGMAIARQKSIFRKTSLALAVIYILIPLLIHFSVIQFFILP